LLDVMMPDISGFDTAVILKKDDETKDIPIIFLTALNNPSDLVHGFQVGANDFLTKPFNKEELVMRVMHQVSLVAAKKIIMEQNNALRNTIENRDKMYSVIAHDLRSPMASIRMVLNLVVNTVTKDMIGPEIWDLLDKANKEVAETHDLLDNLLKWTKSMTGRLNVVYQDFDLNEVIPGVVDIFKMIAETKNIELKYMGSGEPLKVHADNDMLKTVIRNFMSNAIKFSPENSSIEVSSTKEGDFARVSVRDHGVGIAADRLSNVFSDGSTTSGTIGEEGSGLGLQLCANFAHKIGGDVSVESTEGEGSTFSVTIPLKKEGEA
jgi:two-component system sensor histidine kinase/response regulator